MKLRFTLRDTLWFVLLVGIGLGWWVSLPGFKPRVADESARICDYESVSLSNHVPGVMGEGIGCALSLPEATEQGGAVRFGSRRLRLGPKALQQMIDYRAGKPAPEIKRADGVLLVFAAPVVSEFHFSFFEIEGIESISRSDNVITIRALCKLFRRNTPSDYAEWYMNFVAARLDLRDAKYWPAGEYEVRLEYALIDDIYLKQEHPESRQKPRQLRARETLATEFVLVE